MFRTNELYDTKTCEMCVLTLSMTSTLLSDLLFNHLRAEPRGMPFDFW